MQKLVLVWMPTVERQFQGWIQRYCEVYRLLDRPGKGRSPREVRELKDASKSDAVDG